MKGIIGIPYIASSDLLRMAVDSIASLWPITLIVDNSGELRQDEWPCQVCSQLVPLSHAQSMNFIFKRALLGGCDFACYLHSDARSVDGAHERLLRQAEETVAEDEFAALLFTNYDALALYNMRAVRQIGGYDTNLPNYYNDIDYHRRLRLAGYHTVDTGLPVEHPGSMTLKRDPRLAAMLSRLGPLYGQYYAMKWGGPPGEETFPIAFNDPQLIDPPLDQPLEL